MLAIGAGGLDVAVAMGGGAFHLSMPKVFGVRLTGTLRPGVSAKDVILEVLRRETVKGGVGSVYEYFGPGVAGLSVPQRATITNMGAELGATCSVFPSDETTRRFMALMGREDDFTALEADEGATYDKIIEIDLTALESMAAQPHSPDAVGTVSSLAGKPVTQVVIGSCTNSSLDDLTAVASIVKGKHVAPGVEAGIAPGSRQTLMAAEKSGVLGELHAVQHPGRPDVGNAAAGDDPFLHRRAGRVEGVLDARLLLLHLALGGRTDVDYGSYNFV